MSSVLRLVAFLFFFPSHNVVYGSAWKLHYVPGPDAFCSRGPCVAATVGGVPGVAAWRTTVPVVQSTCVL